MLMSTLQMTEAQLKKDDKSAEIQPPNFKSKTKGKEKRVLDSIIFYSVPPRGKNYL